MPTGIALLGSTGSIGTQTLDVLRALPARFRLVSIAAKNNIDLLTDQVAEFAPDVVVAREGAIIDGHRVLPTPEGLIEAVSHPDVDIVVAATSGHEAIAAIIAAIEAGKTIALANKEAVVCAGAIIVPLARRLGVDLRSVDSEHSAIWQSIQGSKTEEIDRLILTASGGPFRHVGREDLANVSFDQALKHPNWSMGTKITIDSSTLFNKGLEIIEAHWLFDVPYDRIEVVVHPEQLIHSMVEFTDGSLIAQMSPPDMHLPIQYALTWPDRVSGPAKRLDLATLSSLTFEQPDLERFPALRIAVEAGRAGGTAPTVLSAVDEVAVEAFATGRIGWTGLARLLETVMARHEVRDIHTIDDVLDADTWARSEASRVIAQR